MFTLARSLSLRRAVARLSVCVDRLPLLFGRLPSARRAMAVALLADELFAYSRAGGEGDVEPDGGAVLKDDYAVQSHRYVNAVVTLEVPFWLPAGHEVGGDGGVQDGVCAHR